VQISEAQFEMRGAFLGGFMGQLVSAVIWAGAAALGTWVGSREAIILLVVAGVFIFPATQVGLRLIGRPGRVGADNGLYSLGGQVAIVLPLCLPVVGAATAYRFEWFLPAFVIVLGAHYLPFVFLYGMRMFFVLGAILWTGGLSLALWLEAPWEAGAWATSVVLLIFAFLGRMIVLTEEAEIAAS
jgi:hypothetical protein